MKKFILAVFTAALFFAISVSLSGQTSQASSQDPRFMEVYQKVVALNKDRFHDIDLIQIGDTVLLPSLVGAGTEYWIADYPQANIHDCLWRITGKYLSQEIETAPAVIVAPTPTPAPVVAPKADHSWPWWLIALLAIVLGAALFLIWYLTRNNRHPVIRGGLSNDPALAARQITAAYPRQSPAVTVTRGTLISADGRPARVMTQFSNGARNATLQSGESAYQVVRQNGNTDYYRQHCGNLVGEVSDGRFQLPEGWSFVPAGESHQATPATSTNQEATPVPTPAINFEGLAAVIEAAGKVQHDSVEIAFGELSIKLKGRSAGAEEKKEEKAE